MNRRLAFVAMVVTLSAIPAAAQPANTCRFICELEWKIEPTFTIDNLAKRHRVAWLGFTAEAITAPFADDNEVQLEFETNFHWLPDSRTKGWLSSHFDVVDKFSPAERPHSSAAYTHKLDLELDTALHPFNWLPEDRWLRGVELETSLDYLATGLPRKGDLFADGSRYLDDASRWSLSFAAVIPVAPF